MCYQNALASLVFTRSLYKTADTHTRTHTLELKIIFHELGGEWIEDKEGKTGAVGINVYTFKECERSNGMTT